VIAIDTSALMAIVLGEPEAGACMDVLEAEPEVLVSAGTVAEALIVSGRRNVAGEMSELVERMGFTITPVSAADAGRIGQAYAQWGRGAHPAGLNFGDCFAYVVAKVNGCPLLFVGDDFGRTDVASALAAGR
jgi:ribonuclease VapC